MAVLLQLGGDGRLESAYRPPVDHGQNFIVVIVIAAI